MFNEKLWIKSFTSNFIYILKGVVHFSKKTFADNLLTPMSSKMSMSVEKKLRFLMKTFQHFSPYNTLQWEPNGSRSK